MLPRRISFQPTVGRFTPSDLLRAMPGHWQLRELAGAYVNGNGRKTGELTKWGLNGVKAIYPMALDEDDRRLFVVTRRPPFLMVLDTNTGKEAARVPAGDRATLPGRTNQYADLCTIDKTIN